MVRFKAKGLRNFDALVKAQPEKARKAASIALNYGGRQAVIRGTREIGKQVNLTQSYIRSGLRVGQFSSPSRLLTVVSARQRATSLRRFNATPATRKGKNSGVRVSVKRGSRKLLKRGFLIKLRRGKTDGFNEGVAVRLKAGESMENKGKSFDKNDAGLFLLYGPSVDQLFQTVRNDIHPELDRDISNEFNRQFSR